MSLYKHECPDWDYLSIDENSPEFAACLCYDDKLAKLYGELHSSRHHVYNIETEIKELTKEITKEKL